MVLSSAKAFLRGYCIDIDVLDGRASPILQRLSIVDRRTKRPIVAPRFYPKGAPVISVPVPLAAGQREQTLRIVLPRGAFGPNPYFVRVHIGRLTDRGRPWLTVERVRLYFEGEKGTRKKK